MAFDYETPVAGYAGAPFMTRMLSTPILEFYREYYNRYYTGTEMVADVAVLHNWPSMAYSINDTYVPVTLMEQVLIQHKVPFDILFDENINQIDRYGEVILAGTGMCRERAGRKAPAIRAPRRHAGAHRQHRRIQRMARTPSHQPAAPGASGRQGPHRLHPGNHPRRQPGQVTGASMKIPNPGRPRKKSSA